MQQVQEVAPNREAGFTLIEALFVLSIFLIISAVTAIVIKPQFTSLEKQLFFTNFRTDLLYAQQYALSHHQEVTIQIVPEQGLYSIRGRYDERLLQRKIPDYVEFDEISNMYYFKVLPNGNFNRFGTFHVRIGGEKYRITFYIGRGRYYVEKE